MNRLEIYIILGSLMALGSLAGCGGGGDGSPPAPTAVVTLSTSGSLPGGVTALSGAYVNLTIPATVSGTPQVVQSGMLAGSKGSISFRSYSAATATRSGSLKFYVVSNDNSSFTIGEFATVSCSFAGTPPTASDFPYAEFLPADLLQQPVIVDKSAAVTIR